MIDQPTVDAAALAFVRATSTADLEQAAAEHKATTAELAKTNDPRLVLLRGVYRRKREELERWGATPT